MIVCNECGGQNADTARTCANCGARFDERGGAGFSVKDRTVAASTIDEMLLPPSLDGADSLLRMRGTGLEAVAEPRNPALVLVLSFVTCYVYLVYWWYLTGKEIKAATGNQELNPQLDLILNILTLSLYSIYLSYKYPKLMLEMEGRVQIEEKDQSLLTTLLSLFSLGPIAAYLVQTDLNRIWEAARRRP
jgi:hypothetical protein